MSSYGTVDHALWRHKKFKSLSDSAKMLFLYFKTCEHNNAIGCFRLPILYIVSDIGWEEEKIRKFLDELKVDKFALYDDETETMFLPRHLKSHPIQNENQAKGAVKCVLKLDNSIPYLKDLITLVLDQERVKEPLANPLQTLLKNITVSVPVSTTVSNNNPETEKDPQAYAFEGHRIKLNHSDFDRMKNLYSNLDLLENLEQLDIELRDSTNKAWFPTLNAKLNYRNDKKSGGQNAGFDAGAVIAKRAMQN